LGNLQCVRNIAHRNILSPGAFSAGALADIAAEEARLKAQGLKALLAQILSQNIRNPRDRAQSEEGRDLGFFLHDFEARFSVRDGTATVLRLETGTKMHKKERRTPPGSVA